MNRNLLPIFLAIVAALLLARVAFYTPQQAAQPRGEPPAALHNILLAEPRPLSDFTLRDHNGQPLGLAQLKGYWSFVFFGYTHCPDICPTTLGVLKGVATQLEAEPQFGADTRFLFVSVDPKRDTLPHLKDYIRYFHPDFVAATGEQSSLDQLARQLGAIYMFEGDTGSSDYIVNHSASVALIDPQGEWVARFNPPHTVKQFLSNYLLLRNYLQTTTPQD